VRRKKIYIGSGRTVPDGCPNCGHELSGATGVKFGGRRPATFSQTSLKGVPTLCCYCGALLIFSDDAGHVRVMTAAERTSLQLSPELEFLIQITRARIAGGFTSRSGGKN